MVENDKVIGGELPKSKKDIYENSKIKLSYVITCTWLYLTLFITIAPQIKEIGINLIQVVYYNMWLISFGGIMAYMGLNISNNVIHFAIKKKAEKKND